MLPMVPLKVPPSVPLPVFTLRATPVAGLTLAGFPFASCDCTTTEKPVPAVGLLPPLMDVIASFVGVPAVILKLLPVTAVRPLLVAWMV